MFLVSKDGNFRILKTRTLTRDIRLLFPHEAETPCGGNFTPPRLRQFFQNLHQQQFLLINNPISGPHTRMAVHGTNTITQFNSEADLRWPSGTSTEVIPRPLIRGQSSRNMKHSLYHHPQKTQPHRTTHPHLSLPDGKSALDPCTDQTFLTG